MSRSPASMLRRTPVIFLLLSSVGIPTFDPAAAASVPDVQLAPRQATPFPNANDVAITDNLHSVVSNFGPGHSTGSNGGSGTGNDKSDDWGIGDLVNGFKDAESSAMLLPSSMGTPPSSDSCSVNNMCPHDSPCCSGGKCGSGSACVTGCDPLGSFSTAACMPMAICQSAQYNFTGASQARILQNSASWDGGVDKFDFVTDAVGARDGSLIKDDQLALSLMETGGTRIWSTRSLMYGSVSAVIKAPAAAGVVATFTLMSGAKDEVDFVFGVSLDFTTNDTNSAQTSYFWLGDAANYTHGSSSQVPPRSEAYHNYTISWMPDELTWLVDGHVIRTVRKSETQDKAVPGRYSYPQTPMRAQLSIWGAGANGDNFDAFGGAVNWHSAEYTKNGSYTAYVKSLTVGCHDVSSLTYVAANSTSHANASALSLPGASGAQASVPAPTLTQSLQLGPGLASPPPWYSAGAASTMSPTTTVWWTPEPTGGQAAVPGTAPSPTVSPWMPGHQRERRLHAREWGESSAAPLDGATSPSTSLWWTPVSAIPPASGGAPNDHTWSSAAPGTGWSGAPANQQLMPMGRNVTSYIYLSNDTYGQIQIGISNASTIISSPGDTGLTAGLNAASGGSVLGTGGILGGWNPDSVPSSTLVWTTVTTTNADGSIATLTSSTMTKGTSTSTATASPSTMAQRWDSLSTAAHVGVYVGCGAVALLIVAGIGFLWSKAGSSSNHNAGQYGGSYQPIGDQGEMLATGPMASSHGLGPGEQQYDAAPTGSYGTIPPGSYAPPPTFPPGPPAPRFQGGYIPSSQRVMPYQ